MAKKNTTSPKSSSKSCLCENGTYSKECCKGETINQGIGSTKQGGASVITNTNSERTMIRQNG